MNREPIAFAGNRLVARRIVRTNLVVLALGAFLLLAGLSFPPDRDALVFLLFAWGIVASFAHGHAHQRFTAPEEMQWLVATGAVTRTWLARSCVLQELVDAVVRAAATTAVLGVATRDRPFYFESSLPPASGWLELFAVWLGVNLVARVGWAIVYNLSGSTHAPRVLASANQRFDRLDVRSMSDLVVLHVAVAILVVAPLAVLFVLRYPLLPLVVGVAWLGLLYVIVEGLEFAHAGGAERAPLVPRAERAHLRVRASTSIGALTWRSMRVRFKLAVVFVLVLVAARIARPPSTPAWLAPEDVVPVVPTGLCIWFLFWGKGAFTWRSHGETSEFLELHGVGLRRQRRIELVSGLVLLVVALVAIAIVLRLSSHDAPAVFWYSTCVFASLTSVDQSLVRAGPIEWVRGWRVSVLAAVVLVAVSVALCIGAVCARGLGIPREVWSVVVDAACAVLVLGAVVSWLRSWRATRDEPALRALEASLAAGA